MTDLIPFTSNVTDVSTYEGYQYEFHCLRCGNGYRSAFRHSVTGFGGRLAALGGSLLGGELGARVEEVGMLAQWGRSGTRGTTNDRNLLEASHDVAGQFRQCRTCKDWVCVGVCWNAGADCCDRCQPPPAPGYPGAGPSTGGTRCAQCGAVGSGRFCGGCGSSLTPPAACRGCGAPPEGTRFCPHCGTPAGR